jgi:hypothetical protein
MTLKNTIKDAALPHGRTVRRLPAGIGRGLKMGVDFHRGETRLFLGLYEAELNRHLKRIAKPGYKSFDVGGHFGYDALVLAKLTNGPVVSIESEEEYAQEIEDNAAANPGLAPITVVLAFAGDTDDAPNISIDTLAERHFVPDLLKIDIEGAEVAALRGATRVLRERRPAILLEVHGKEIEWECLAILRDAGYAPPTVVDRRRWLPEHRPLPHNRWLIFEG